MSLTYRLTAPLQATESATLTLALIHVYPQCGYMSTLTPTHSLTPFSPFFLQLVQETMADLTAPPVLTHDHAD